MKVLVLSHEFPPIGGGGGQVVKNICEGLAERDYDLRVLTAGLRGDSGGAAEKGYLVYRLPTIRSHFARARFFDMASYVVSAIIYGTYACWAWQPDVIHVHFAVPAGPVAWFLSKIFRTPYVLTTHLGDVPGGSPKKTQTWFRFIKPFTYPIWKGAKKIVAVSAFTQQLAEQVYHVPVQVIPNGITVDHREKRLDVHDPPHIIFAGRFVPQKNPVCVIEVMALLKELDWNMTMLGDGALFSTVQNEILAAGLTERITLEGWVTPERVKDVLKDGDILFMPSRTEGMSIVGLEALNSGMVLVVTRTGGFVDMVAEKKNGFMLSPYAAPEAFAQALRALLTDTKMLTSYKAESRKRARNFDLEEVCQAYDTLFKRLS